MGGIHDKGAEVLEFGSWNGIIGEKMVEEDRKREMGYMTGGRKCWSWRGIIVE